MKAILIEPWTIENDKENFIYHQQLKKTINIQEESEFVYSWTHNNISTIVPYKSVIILNETYTIKLNDIEMSIDREIFDHFERQRIDLHFVHMDFSSEYTHICMRCNQPYTNQHSLCKDCGSYQISPFLKDKHKIIAYNYIFALKKKNIILRRLNFFFNSFDSEHEYVFDSLKNNIFCNSKFSNSITFELLFNRFIYEKYSRFKIECNLPQYYYFTFGNGQKCAGKYIKLLGTFDTTRDEIINKFGTKWSMQYNKKDWFDNTGVSQSEKHDYKEINIGEVI